MPEIINSNGEDRIVEFYTKNSAILSQEKARRYGPEIYNLINARGGISGEALYQAALDNPHLAIHEEIISVEDASRRWHIAQFSKIIRNLEYKIIPLRVIESQRSEPISIPIVMQEAVPMLQNTISQSFLPAGATVRSIASWQETRGSEYKLQEAIVNDPQERKLKTRDLAWRILNLIEGKDTLYPEVSSYINRIRRACKDLVKSLNIESPE